MSLARFPALLVALALAGCDAALGGPSSAAPVIQILLVAGDSVQTGKVEWRFPADSPVNFTSRPVDSTLVQLLLVLPGGSTVPFTPRREQPGGGFIGRYAASVVATYGATYQLQGSVAGRVVAATTTVPDSLRILEPARDTVTISAASCSFYCSVPFHWVAAGADQYQYLQVKSGGFVGAGSTADTAGVLNLFQARPGADTMALVVYALEPQAAAFLLPETPKGSITGLFGLFGAASRAQRVLVWQ